MMLNEIKRRDTSVIYVGHPNTAATMLPDCECERVFVMTPKLPEKLNVVNVDGANDRRIKPKWRNRIAEKARRKARAAQRGKK